MSKTLWYPFPRHKPRQWLLGNGEIVTEPTMEQSGSGKKLRIVGTETSAYTKDMNTMILAAVDETAKAKNTYVWQPLHEREERMLSTADVSLQQNRGDLYLLRPGDDVRTKGATRLWWRFTHPEFPSVEAVLVVNAYPAGTGHQVNVTLTMPDTRVTDLMEPSFVKADSENFVADAWYYFTSYGQDHKFRTFGLNNPPEWTRSLVGSTTWVTDRQVAQELLRLCNLIDSFAEIEVLDARDIDDLKYMTLEPTQSNYNGGFRQSVAEYLAGATGIEQATRIYRELVDAMRSLGITMGPVSENDFQRALLEGEEHALRTEIGPVAGEEGHRHTLHVHLSTGTFAMTCPHHNPDVVATEWERVKTIAQLTGEEPALLAFATEYGRSRDDARARKVMRDRMKGARED